MARVADDILPPPGGIAIRRVCLLVGWFVRSFIRSCVPEGLRLPDWATWRQLVKVAVGALKFGFGRCSAP